MHRLPGINRLRSTALPPHHREKASSSSLATRGCCLLTLHLYFFLFGITIISRYILSMVISSCNTPLAGILWCLIRGGIYATSTDHRNGIPLRTLQPRMDTQGLRSGAIGLPEVQEPVLESPKKECEACLDVDLRRFQGQDSDSFARGSAHVDGDPDERQIAAKFPDNQWVHRMEKEIALKREKDANGIFKWKI
jgi:hypothetical protein